MPDNTPCSIAGQKGSGVNIVNVDEVEAFVERFARRIGRAEGQQWCRHNLRKYVLREARLARPVGQSEIAGFLDKEREGDLPAWVSDALRCGRALHWFEPEVETWDGHTDFIQALHCVMDWIETLPEADRRWRQFHKIGVPQAISAARAWQQTLAKRAEEDWPEDWSGIRTVMRFEDGVKFVNLTSRAALEREGHMMSHCVASYGGEVECGCLEIYSLRDTHNRPHVTIEAKSNRVVQTKGKKNSIPGARWQPYIKAFVGFMGWRGWERAAHIERFVFCGRGYAHVAEVIADLPELIDLDAAVFDYRLLIPVFRFIGLIVQGGADAFTAEHERMIVAMLRARIAANRGYRVSPAAAAALELPRSSIVETAVELAGAAFALAEMGILSEAREQVAELCRQVGLNVLALIKKRPELLYRLQVASGRRSTVQDFARFIAAAGLADEFYRVRRAAIEHKRQHVGAAIVALRHRLGERRTVHAIAETERARAIRLIRVQAPRFCDVTLRDALVA
jgi:hypothetical protein